MSPLLTPLHKTPSTHPIDVLLSASRARKHLKPLRSASRQTLLRRIYVDLLGWTPNLSEQKEFLEDRRPDAYERLVDRLLSSPHHGERWGRHWMDIWRYADWYGLNAQLRNSQKHIWKWRDWIIESLNEDKGYDRMILEMLAADEIYPTDRGALRGTGFLARNYYLFNRTTWLDATIEHTSKAFMGLTMNCAKCHDHKYDPISQVDYYRFRAFFEPHQVRLDAVRGETDLEKDGLPRVFDAHLDAKTYVHIQGDEKRPDMTKELAPGVPKIFTEILAGNLAMRPLKIHALSLPLEAHTPAMRPHVLEDALSDANAEIARARSRLHSARKKADALVASAIHLPKAKGHIPETAELPEAAGLPAAEGTPVAVGDSRKNGDGDAIRMSELDLDVTQKLLEAAEDEPAALRASYAADRARFESQPTEHVDALVNRAARTSRQLELKQAEAKLAQSEQKLFQTRGKPENAAAEKARKAAFETLEKRRKAITAPGTAYTSLRASRKALEGPDEKEASRRMPYPTRSTGRRSALARWLVDPGHPLTARVAMNHIWMRHFGQPLVESVTDFGLRAPRPKQKELLDWLAIEFVRSGWSFKHIHKLIVTSDAYRRMSSTIEADETTRRSDETNDYYWRRKPFRMEAQVIRDSLLHLADALDPRIGGPSLDSKSGEAARRRSIYFKHSRDQRHEFLSTFDDADILRCYRRSESIVPQQALALSNSKLSLSLARRIAARISMNVTTPGGEDARQAGIDDGEEAFIQLAFQMILTRAPGPREMTTCRETLVQLRAHLATQSHEDIEDRAHADLVHALINHNDFITIR